MTTTSDEPALLAAIAAHPDEDIPRLVYADWLEENASTVKCKRCYGSGKRDPSEDVVNGKYVPKPEIGCSSCKGTGSVSDGRAERAEFIRLQIALAWPDSELPRCVACNGTRFVPTNDESADPDELDFDCAACFDQVRLVYTGTNRNAMTARVSALWHGGVSSQFATNAIRAAVVNPPSAFTDHDPVLLVTRGFAETLYLPTLAGLCEREQRECEYCYGRKEWFIEQLQNYYPCMQCNATGKAPGDYTGKPTQLALDVVRAHPTITRVVWGAATEMLAMSLLRQANPDMAEFAQANLPEFLFRLVADLPLSTEEESADALAVAAGQWLRQKAGI